MKTSFNLIVWNFEFDDEMDEFIAFQFQHSSVFM